MVIFSSENLSVPRLELLQSLTEDFYVRMALIERCKFDCLPQNLQYLQCKNGRGTGEWLKKHPPMTTETSSYNKAALPVDVETLPATKFDPKLASIPPSFDLRGWSIEFSDLTDFLRGIWFENDEERMENFIQMQEQFLDKIRECVHHFHSINLLSEKNYQCMYVHPFLDQFFRQVTLEGNSVSVLDARKMDMEKELIYVGARRTLVGSTDMVLQTGDNAFESVRGFVELKRAFDSLFQSVWDRPRKQVIAQLTMFRSEKNSDLVLKACVTDLFGCCVIVHPPLIDGHNAEYFISQRCSSSREVVLLLLLIGSELTSAHWDALIKSHESYIVCVDDADREAASTAAREVFDIDTKDTVASRTRSACINSKPSSNDNSIAQKGNVKAAVANKENQMLSTGNHIIEVGGNSFHSDCVYQKTSVLVRLTEENLAMYAN